MDSQQSSASAAVDPDRISIQYCEKGGANPQRDAVVVVRRLRYFDLRCYIILYSVIFSFPSLQVPNEDDETGKCVTFSIKNEDHTLGNILRHIIMQK